MINEFEASFNLARRMREAGIAWEAVAKVTGISPEMLRRRMEPGYSERRNAGIRNARALRRGEPSPGGIVRSERYHIKPEDAARALATVPTDTRPLASRLMGDPLPGRSALDKQTHVPVQYVRRGAAGLSTLNAHTHKADDDF